MPKKTQFSIGFGIEGTKKAAQDFNKFTSELQRSLKSFSKQFEEILPARGPLVQVTGTLFLLKGALGGVERALSDLSDFFIGANSKIEQFQTALSSTLGTIAQADVAINKFARRFAAIVPFFEAEEVIAATTRLAAEGFSLDKLTGALASGFDEKGVFRQQFEGSLVGIIADMSAAFGKTLEQGTDAFISAIQGRFVKIRKFGIDTSTLFQFGFSGIRDDTEGLAAAIERIMELRFGGILVRLSGTFKGAVQNIQDLINNIRIEAFEGIFKTVREELVSIASGLASLTDKSAEGVKDITKSIGDAFNKFLGDVSNGLAIITKDLLTLAKSSAVAFAPLLIALTTVLSISLATRAAIFTLLSSLRGLGKALGILKIGENGKALVSVFPEVLASVKSFTGSILRLFFSILAPIGRVFSKAGKFVLAFGSILSLTARSIFDLGSAFLRITPNLELFKKTIGNILPKTLASITLLATPLATLKTALEGKLDLALVNFLKILIAKISPASASIHALTASLKFFFADIKQFGFLQTLASNLLIVTDAVRKLAISFGASRIFLVKLNSLTLFLNLRFVQFGTTIATIVPKIFKAFQVFSGVFSVLSSGLSAFTSTASLLLSTLFKGVALLGTLFLGVFKFIAIPLIIGVIGALQDMSKAIQSPRVEAFQKFIKELEKLKAQVILTARSIGKALGISLSTSDIDAFFIDLGSELIKFSVKAIQVFETIVIAAIDLFRNTILPIFADILRFLGKIAVILLGGFSLIGINIGRDIENGLVGAANAIDNFVSNTQNEFEKLNTFLKDKTFGSEIFSKLEVPKNELAEDVKTATALGITGGIGGAGIGLLLGKALGTVLGAPGGPLGILAAQLIIGGFGADLGGKLGATLVPLIGVPVAKAFRAVGKDTNAREAAATAIKDLLGEASTKGIEEGVDAKVFTDRLIGEPAESRLTEFANLLEAEFPILINTLSTRLEEFKGLSLVQAFATENDPNKLRIIIRQIEGAFRAEIIRIQEVLKRTDLSIGERNRLELQIKELEGAVAGFSERAKRVVIEIPVGKASKDLVQFKEQMIATSDEVEKRVGAIVKGIDDLKSEVKGIIGKRFVAGLNKDDRKAQELTTELREKEVKVIVEQFEALKKLNDETNEADKRLQEGLAKVNKLRAEQNDILKAGIAQVRTALNAAGVGAKAASNALLQSLVQSQLSAQSISDFLSIVRGEGATDNQIAAVRLALVEANKVFQDSKANLAEVQIGADKTAESLKDLQIKSTSLADSLRTTISTMTQESKQQREAGIISAKSRLIQLVALADFLNQIANLKLDPALLLEQQKEIKDEALKLADAVKTVGSETGKAFNAITLDEELKESFSVMGGMLEASKALERIGISEVERRKFLNDAIKDSITLLNQFLDKQRDDFNFLVEAQSKLREIAFDIRASQKRAGFVAATPEVSSDELNNFDKQLELKKEINTIEEQNLVTKQKLAGLDFQIKKLIENRALLESQGEKAGKANEVKINDRIKERAELLKQSFEESAKSFIKLRDLQVSGQIKINELKKKTIDLAKQEKKAQDSYSESVKNSVFSLIDLNTLLTRFKLGGRELTPKGKLIEGIAKIEALMKQAETTTGVEELKNIAKEILTIGNELEGLAVLPEDEKQKIIAFVEKIKEKGIDFVPEASELAKIHEEQSQVRNELLSTVEVVNLATQKIAQYTSVLLTLAQLTSQSIRDNAAIFERTTLKDPTEIARKGLELPAFTDVDLSKEAKEAVKLFKAEDKEAAQKLLLDRAAELEKKISSQTKKTNDKTDAIVQKTVTQASSSFSSNVENMSSLLQNSVTNNVTKLDSTFSDVFTSISATFVSASASIATTVLQNMQKGTDLVKSSQDTLERVNRGLNGELDRSRLEGITNVPLRERGTTATSENAILAESIRLFAKQLEESNVRERRASEAREAETIVIDIQPSEMFKVQIQKANESLVRDFAKAGSRNNGLDNP